MSLAIVKCKTIEIVRGMGSLVSVVVAIIATTLAVVLAPVTQALQETHNPIQIAATEALVLRQVDRLID